jgi:hypothetical protein
MTSIQVLISNKWLSFFLKLVRLKVILSCLGICVLWFFLSTFFYYHCCCWNEYIAEIDVTETVSESQQIFEGEKNDVTLTPNIEIKSTEKEAFQTT